MPDSICNGNPTCLHGEDDGDEDIESQVEESDPSGRYIRYKEILGKGAFKTVYRGFDEIDGIEVAWNQIKLQDILRSPQDLELLYSEVHLLKTLKHRNIIKFHHSWVDMKMDRINFITELFTSGTLRQYRKRHKHVDLKAVKTWCRQILRGLLYLHSHDPPIIHRDLKCDNIFINGNHGEVKIGDLGLAAILCQAHAAHSIIGTPEFMAPELYEEEYTELVDIYSFGMCLLEMVTLEYPYSECDNAAQIYKKVSSGIKPAALDKLKDVELRQFVEKCIDTASKRLPARELLMDPFLQCVDRVDSRPVLSRDASKSEQMEDFAALLQSASSRSSFTHTEMNSSSIASLASTTVADSDLIDSVHVIPKSTIRRLGSADLKKEKAGRNTVMDVRVKGKKRENDIVYLRLRIAAEGNVRIIHFPFDVEADTAMCVASEMVAELDLADQDVTKIAEMIDGAVLVMVPEWKPGVAIDERCECEENAGKQHGQSHPSATLGSDTPTLSSDISLTKLIRQGSQSWHSHVGAISAGVVGPPQNGANVHGRFEEVMHHHLRHQNGNEEDEQCTVTTQSSDEADVDWEQYDESTSSDISPSCHGAAYAPLSVPSREAPKLFNSLLECSDLTNCPCKLLGSIMGRGDLYSNVMDAWALFQNDFCGYGDENRELLMQEIRNLTLRFQQELKELECKHQTALLDLRKQWESKRVVPRPSEAYESRMAAINEQVIEMQEHGRFLEKTWRTTGVKNGEQSNRLSFKELADLLAQVDPLEDHSINV